VGKRQENKRVDGLIKRFLPDLPKRGYGIQEFFAAKCSEMSPTDSRQNKRVE